MNCSICISVIGMDSKSKLQYQTLMATQDPSKYVLMEDLRCIDPKVDAEEKSTSFMNPTFFQTIFSHGTSTQSSIKDGKIGMPERRTKVALAKSVTAVVIMIVIAIFLVPIIIYYTLKSDSPLPESNSVLGDVNISMVSYCVLTLCSYTVHILLFYRATVQSNYKFKLSCMQICGYAERDAMSSVMWLHVLHPRPTWSRTSMWGN